MQRQRNRPPEGDGPSRTVRLAATTIAALALFAVAPSLAAAQPGGATTGNDLFVATAAGGTLTPAKGGGARLELRGAGRSVTAFTDRPARRAGTEALSAFVARWRARGFAADPPNAALVLDAPSGRDVFVYTLSRPRLTSQGSLVFTARRLRTSPGGSLERFGRRADARAPRRFGRASLFVDPADAENLTVKVNVANVAAGGTLLVSFSSYLLSGTVAETLWQFSGTGQIKTGTDFVLMTAARSGPVSATGTFGLTRDSGSDALEGNVQSIPAGATVTIAINGGTPTPVTGPFSLPVS